MKKILITITDTTLLTVKKSIKPLCAIALSSTFMGGSLSAAVIALTGGVEGGNPGIGADRYVVDLNFLVPTLFTTNRVLFEAGGNGDGVALALINNDLFVFHDIATGAPAGDKTTTIDISSMAGSYVSIRLQGDFTNDGTLGNEDTFRLDVTDGSSSFNSVVDFNVGVAAKVGADGYGTGGRGGANIAGNGTNSNFSALNQPSYVIASGANGSNVLGASEITGTLYTGASDSDAAIAAGIPSPIPEPSSTALLGLGGLALILRRRK